MLKTLSTFAVAALLSLTGCKSMDHSTGHSGKDVCGCAKCAECCKTPEACAKCCPTGTCSMSCCK